MRKFTETDVDSVKKVGGLWINAIERHMITFAP